MLTRFGDFDPTFSLLDELRRRMDRVWDDIDTDEGPGTLSSATWPRVNLYDAGSELVLKADVPGMSEAEIQVSLHNGALSISGERKARPPQGYTVQRQERAALQFARTIALPCKVNPEQTTASVKDGVLTITLAKAPEAQPRQIAIRTN